MPRLFSTLFPSEFGDLDEVVEGEGEEIGVMGGVKDEVRESGLEPGVAVVQRTASDGAALRKEANEVKETISGVQVEGEDGAAALVEDKRLAGVEERVRGTGFESGASGSESVDNEQRKEGKAEGLVEGLANHRSGLRVIGVGVTELVRGSVEDELQEGLTIRVDAGKSRFGSASPRHSEGRSSPRFERDSRLRGDLAVCQNRPRLEGQHGSEGSGEGRAASEEGLRPGVRSTMGEGLQRRESPRKREGARQAAMRAGMRKTRQYQHFKFAVVDCDI